MRPLEGITIVGLSTMITASLAAMMAGEQGARVIKVEPLDQGDPMRYIGSARGGDSGLFANCNRGKASLSLGLKRQVDRGKSKRANQTVHQTGASPDCHLCERIKRWHCDK